MRCVYVDGKRNSCSNDFCDYFQCDRVGVARGEISLSFIYGGTLGYDRVKKIIPMRARIRAEGNFFISMGLNRYFHELNNLSCSLPLKGVLEFSSWNVNMCSLFIVEDLRVIFLKILASFILGTKNFHQKVLDINLITYQSSKCTR